MITYDRYTELLSKHIHRTITAAEQKDVAAFEVAQPKTCPRCGAPVRSFFLPNQVAHDVDKCQPQS